LTKNRKLLEFCSKGGIVIGYKVKGSEVKGKYIHLPDNIKEDFGEKLVLFRNKKGYFIFSINEWEDLFSRIDRKRKGRLKRNLKRSFSKRAKIVNIKKDGTLLVPSNLRSGKDDCLCG